jgi:DNA mismatch repair protein MLH1
MRKSGVNPATEIEFISPPRKPKRPIFDELKYQPLPSRYTRGDHRDRTIEQLVRPKYSICCAQPFRDFLDLFSLKKLRSQVEKRADSNLCSIFRTHILIGLIDLSYALISSESSLYKLSLFPVSQLFFYQRILLNFGNFGTIRFTPALNIWELMSLLNVEDAVVVLEKHRKMLHDYFAIEIESGELKAMPWLLPGYIPTFSAMPVFLARLASEIDWESELECIGGIARELSMLYAVMPEDAKNCEQKERLEEDLRNVLLPEMKSKCFMPHSKLLVDGTVMMIGTVAGMYSVFERT